MSMFSVSATFRTCVMPIFTVAGDSRSIISNSSLPDITGISSSLTSTAVGWDDIYSIASSE